ncbi:uncharacterized protein C8Q71DRAFT_721937 [Rhodofomes roseus]|uniref:Uncharacterized protein n=1 Tax=Rhodofomes roseus TaxID=34475 RepID=A0ABQ8KPJ0_9APHY|nr:uncharacterized protein C8Q71DRAFT_721937 [Rhodofomes roseus]KAH9840226.1 hypothetical protein C8Q71DRAFT_721937 [Rhodofomes roseus]
MWGAVQQWKSHLRPGPELQRHLRKSNQKESQHVMHRVGLIPVVNCTGIPPGAREPIHTRSGQVPARQMIAHRGGGARAVPAGRRREAVPLEMVVVGSEVPPELTGAHAALKAVEHEHARAAASANLEFPEGLKLLTGQPQQLIISSTSGYCTSVSQNIPAWYNSEHNYRLDDAPHAVATLLARCLHADHTECKVAHLSDTAPTSSSLSSSDLHDLSKWIFVVHSDDERGQSVVPGSKAQKWAAFVAHTSGRPSMAASTHQDTAQLDSNSCQLGGSQGNTGDVPWVAVTLSTQDGDIQHVVKSIRAGAHVVDKYRGILMMNDHWEIRRQDTVDRQRQGESSFCAHARAARYHFLCQPLLPYLLKDVRKELPVPQYEARYTPTSPAAAERGQPASAVDVHTGDATAAHNGEQGQLEFGLGHETVTPSPESSPSTPLKVGVGVHMQKRTTLAGLAQTAVLCMKRMGQGVYGRVGNKGKEERTHNWSMQNPGAEGWTSEALWSIADGLLKLLKRLMDARQQFSTFTDEVGLGCPGAVGVRVGPGLEQREYPSTLLGRDWRYLWPGGRNMPEVLLISLRVEHGSSDVLCIALHQQKQGSSEARGHVVLPHRRLMWAEGNVAPPDFMWVEGLLGCKRGVEGRDMRVNESCRSGGYWWRVRGSKFGYPYPYPVVPVPVTLTDCPYPCNALHTGDDCGTMGVHLGDQHIPFPCVFVRVCGLGTLVWGAELPVNLTFGGCGVTGENVMRSGEEPGQGRVLDEGEEPCRGRVLDAGEEPCLGIWGFDMPYFPMVMEQAYLDSLDELLWLQHWRALGRIMMEWQLEVIHVKSIQVALGGTVTDMEWELKEVFRL